MIKASRRGLSLEESRPISLHFYALGVAALWSVFIGLSLAWNLKTQRAVTLESTRIEARVTLKKDIIYRRWNADFGGVYAPVTETTQPNPYLNVPERDITTPMGKKLTKINPAYMTRQVHELESKAYGVRGHITSLNPIRPANKADPWEARALKSFQDGVKEVSSVEKMAGEDYMRLMRPLLTEKGCLKCHAEQGYKPGDIRGGISISVPMAPRMVIAKPYIFTLSAGHGFLWLMGIIGIGCGVQRINQQIQGRRLMEDELRVSEKKYRNLVESTTDWVWVCDVEGRQIFANRAVQQMLGYEIGEILGTSILSLVHPEDSERIREKLQKAIQRKRGWKGTVVRWQHKDGSTRFFETAGQPILDSEDNLLGFSGIDRDITARIQAEAALKEYSEQLEEMVAERTKELKDAQEQLVRKEKLAVLGQLTGGVSHELRNPLGAIKNAAYFLNMALEEPEPEVKETLAILEKEVAASENIISTLFDFTSPRHLMRRKVDINKVLRQVLSRIAFPENVAVAKQADETMPSISGDIEQLAIVFGNLINNAIQSMPDGGRLEIKSELSDPEWISIAFTDVGSGIPEKDLEKIFEPLFTTKAKGIGLGLALSKNLVDAHGGTLEVESKVGKGSTFTVKIPIGIDD